MLLERGANIEAKDAYGLTPLFRATWGVADVATEVLNRVPLFNRGANIEAKNNYNHTPLWWAADQGNEDVAKLLLERGANIEVEDS